MDRVAELTNLVQREVEDYARGGASKAIAYPISDLIRQTYCVLVIPDYPRPWRAGIVVAARVVGEYVVIDEDITDRPLVHELVRAGIPRERIVLTYVGERLPESQPDAEASG